MAFGSWAVRPAKRGSEAMTAAAAASGEVTVVDVGRVEDEAEPVGDDGSDCPGVADGLQAPTAKRAATRVKSGTAPARRADGTGKGVFMAQRRSSHSPGSGMRDLRIAMDWSSRVEYSWRRATPDHFRPGRDSRPVPRNEISMDRVATAAPSRCQANQRVPNAQHPHQPASQTGRSHEEAPPRPEPR